MRQKWLSLGDDFYIQDEAGRDVFRVDGKAFCFGDQLSFQDLAGNELAFIKQRLLSWGTLKYKVGNETTTNDLISWDAGLVQETADLVIPIPSVVAGDGIEVTLADNVYTVSTSTDGANLNLSIVYASFDANGHKVAEYTEVESVLYFRNGLFVGTTDPEDSPTSLIEKSVSLARDVT